MNESCIIISIKKIVNSEIGSSKKEKIKHLISQDLDHETMIDDTVIGNVTITNLGENILAKFNLNTNIKQICSRCANDFIQTIILVYQQIFSNKPEDEEFPINSDYTIDAWPSIKQEIILQISMKPLCKSNCKGIKY